MMSLYYAMFSGLGLFCYKYDIKENHSYRKQQEETRVYLYRMGLSSRDPDLTLATKEDGIRH